MFKTYRKKPVTVKAVQLTSDNIEEVFSLLPTTAFDLSTAQNFDDGLVINTLEGKMLAKLDDYIIQGIKGEFYPCDAEIFKLTYDEFYPCSIESTGLIYEEK